MTPITDPDYPRARVVDHLEIDHLPRGAQTRLLVALVHDGLGRSVRLPVLVARGERTGPVFGITAVVHGNELNGIPVIHRLFDQIDLSRLKGSLVGVVVVNVPAYLNNERTFYEREDLNHLMPGRAHGDEAEIYAHRFIDRVVRHFDHLIDLHTASFGRVNSLYVRADMTDATTTQMAYLQRPRIIVHNPASDGTLRGTAMAMGIPAITVEIGNPQVFQPKHIRASLGGIRRVLAEAGMTPRRPITPAPPPMLCERSQWLYTDRGGLLEVFPEVTEVVEANAVIARLRNIFGDVVREYRAPERGVVIGKSVNPVGQTGARILHLGVLAEPGAYPFQAHAAPAKASRKA